MKILFVNLINNVYGHKNFDSLFIDCASQNNSVYYVSEENWYNYQFNHNVIPLFYRAKRNFKIDFIEKVFFIKKV
ncbi:MAG: hypothetical protein K5765_00535, partial [Clostridia bacterium]|nr:hypothetical protein [Clostridia bacterium]